MGVDSAGGRPGTPAGSPADRTPPDGGRVPLPRPGADDPPAVTDRVPVIPAQRRPGERPGTGTPAADLTTPLRPVVPRPGSAPTRAAGVDATDRLSPHPPAPVRPDPTAARPERAAPVADAEPGTSTRPAPATDGPSGDRPRTGGRAARRAADAAPRAARAGRRSRRLPTTRPAGRGAALTVAGGGLLALLAFLAVPHVAVPVAGPLTVPALIGSTAAYEPAARLLWSVGAGATLVALLGAVAAALRGRAVRAVPLAVALVVSALLGLGYLTVGVSALGPGGPALLPGFALVAAGLLTAFVASIAALMTR